MTDKELLYIKTIAEERTISAAAKKLFMTQPALSHCLKVLEASTGTPLFERTSGGLVMTYAGQCYYEMAVSILDIYNDYCQRLVDISQLRSGSLTFGMTRYISCMLSHKLLPVFTSQYPNIAIKITEKESSELEDMIRTRKIDFGIFHCMDIPDKAVIDNLAYTILNQEEMCLVMQQGSRWEKHAVAADGYHYPVLDIKLLDGESFILETKRHRLRQAADQIFQLAQMRADVVLETELFETAYNLASIGYGATIINERYLTDFTYDTSCSVFSIPKVYKPFWNLCYAQHAGGYHTIASKVMLRLLEAEEKNRK